MYRVCARYRLFFIKYQDMIKSLLSIASNIKDGVINTTTSSFAVMATVFLQDSIKHMIPWLIASFAFVVCDLIARIRRCLLMDEQVRFSKAMRDTLGKMVFYFSAICMFSMVCVASGELYHIDRWSCLFIYFVELCSIIHNWLAPKGIDINFNKLAALLFSKKFGGERKEYEDIIEKKE